MKQQQIERKNIIRALGGDSCLALYEIHKNGIQEFQNKKSKVENEKLTISNDFFAWRIAFPTLVYAVMAVGASAGDMFFTDSAMTSNAIIVGGYLMVIIISLAPAKLIRDPGYSFENPGGCWGVNSKALREAKKVLGEYKLKKKPKLEDKVQRALGGDTLDAMSLRIERNTRRVINSGQNELEGLMDRFSFPEFFEQTTARKVSQRKKLLQKFVDLVEGEKEELKRMINEIKEEELV